MNFKIRPFLDGDYPALAELQMRTSPMAGYLPGGDALRELDATRNPKVFCERWSVERGGRVVAQAVLTQDPVFWHPDQYVLNILVEPGQQGTGIGRELYDLLIARLSMRKAALVRCPVHELASAGLGFLGRRGFVETHRMWQSTLDLAAFDESGYEGLYRKLSHAGVSLVSVRELEREPGYAERIYELERHVNRDIPWPEKQPKLSFDDFWSSMNREREDGSHFHVAVQGPIQDGRYLGLSFGFRVRGTDRFHVLLTGVARDARKLGVATALKARSLARSKESGCQLVSTWNDSTNAPMLSLNQKMGFVRHPARIYLQKRLAS